VDPHDSLDQRPLIVCDMAGATDTAAERLEEYRRLFAQALLGRSRTAAGIRFRFRSGPGLLDWVRDLARREKACCAFFDFAVYAIGDEVWWDACVVDDETARQILAEFYHLPDTLADGDAAVRQRFADRGLHVVSGDSAG
jgi:hypothetical protein